MRRARALSDPKAELATRYPDIPFRDVKARCRELRALSDRRAAVQMLACLSVFETLDEDAPVDAFFGPLIDGYQLDLLRRFLNARGKDYISMVGSIFPGRTTVCVNGARPTPSTELDREALEEAVAVLRDKSRIPQYLLNHMQGSAVKRSVTKWAKIWARLLYFGLKTKARPNVIQPHAAQSYYASRYFAQLTPGLSLGRKPYDPDQRFDFVVPLHWYPEATVDYMTDYAVEQDYRDLTRDLVLFLAERGTVLLREHPAVAGLRFKALFRELEAHPNVFISDLTRSSRYEMDSAETVVTVTSNMGLESLADGVPTLTCANAYYDVDGALPRLDIATPETFEATLAEARLLVSTDAGRTRIETIFRRYFQCSCDAPFITNGFKRPMTAEERDAAAHLGQRLSAFLDTLEIPLLSSRG
jgi:hypothetical protein